MAIFFFRWVGGGGVCCFCCQYAMNTCTFSQVGQHMEMARPSLQEDSGTVKGWKVPYFYSCGQWSNPVLETLTDIVVALQNNNFVTAERIGAYLPGWLHRLVQRSLQHMPEYQCAICNAALRWLSSVSPKCCKSYFQKVVIQIYCY